MIEQQTSHKGVSRHYSNLQFWICTHTTARAEPVFSAPSGHLSPVTPKSP